MKGSKEMTNEKTLTINEIADILNVSRTTVNTYIKDKKLKVFKTGESKQSAVRIKESDFKDFIQKHNKGTTWAKYFDFTNESHQNNPEHAKRDKYKLSYSLKEIRELKGYTTQEIADHLKISVKKYESYESTQEAMGSMDVDYLIMLSMLYEIKPSQFSYLNESSNN